MIIDLLDEPGKEIISRDRLLKSFEALEKCQADLPLDTNQQTKLKYFIITASDIGRQDTILQDFDMGIKFMKELKMEGSD